MNILLKIAALLALLLSLVACSSTTVLQATFNTEPIGTPPAAGQPVGTVEIMNGDGSVRVAASPDPSSAAGNNWVQISLPSPRTHPVHMLARFDSFHGAGHYNLVALVFMRSGTEAVSLDLEPFNSTATQQRGRLLHLDFTPENNVRLNDIDTDRFGRFPRDQSFVLAISVDSTVSPAKATISLLGRGASGSRDVDLPASASQFGAVRFWIGFPWSGTVFFDDIIVTRGNP